MKKILALTIVLFIAMVSTARCAESLFPSSEFKIGYQGTYTYYSESIMNESNYQNGGFGSWTGYFTNSHIMTEVEIEGVTGDLDYDGGYSSGGSLKCDTENYFLEGRFLVGKGFDFTNFSITPYTGFGVRYTHDKIIAPGGYTRKITHYYMPFGVKFKAPLQDKWTIGGDAGADLLLYGTVKSKLSEADSTYEDAKNDQNFGSGFGLRISGYAEYNFDSCALGIEPFFKYLYVSESDSDTISAGAGTKKVVEPSNNTYMSGIRLYVKF